MSGYTRVTINAVGWPICPNHGEQRAEYQAQDAPCGCPWFWGRGTDAEYLVAPLPVPLLDNYDAHLHALAMPDGKGNCPIVYTFTANQLFDLIGMLQIVYPLLPPGPQNDLCQHTGREWQQLLVEATGQNELLPFLERGWYRARS